ncbi:hypothetical protein W911_06110 [Hyphomicrobium nitrativorans NL23]|uniref:CopG family transcriptional regulator n=1 Tax=Hyphomicrobium nitrativorans NL23 TaxID=1029756 RepID=V5SIW7_9HYPH|nr:hypothetical protein [Hyphomicrobium nitrativorans]AHB50025.1 hypothetical protein W911_06110 [Hyphomicrobium nitrativorans NL23]
MTIFKKLDAIREHLRLQPEAPRGAPSPIRAALPPETGKRLQKNLSILERDAERLAALSKRDGISQARLLSAALDAYEQSHADEAV